MYIYYMYSVSRVFCEIFRSKNCPECRSTIHHAKQVYLNVSNTDECRKKTNQNKLEKINELNRQKICDLTAAGQNQKREIDELKYRVHELSRMNLLDVGKYTIELRNLEKIINDQRNRYREMRHLVKLKDRTINELNTALKLREMKESNDKKQMEQIRTENAALNDRITQLNQCVNALNLSASTSHPLHSFRHAPN